MFKILLIDRNATFGATFAGLLERSGYRVEVVATLAEGVKHTRLDPPDLILLGIDNDDPTPFAAAGRQLADFKVIALLSRQKRPSEDLKELLHSLRGCPLFYKPFRTEEVLAAIYSELVPQQP